MKEFLLNLLTGSLESIGETKLVAVLQELHDKDEAKYIAAIRGGNALVVALAPMVGKSKTPIDDAILKSLGEAIKASALANDVIL